MSFNLDEVRFLSEHNAELASWDLELSKASQLKDLEKLKAAYGDYARCAMELLTARRGRKLPETWLMDADSAQQATPLPVARYRSEFLQQRGMRTVHDVTCSIGTEGYASCLDYFGSDIDASRLAMARHNLDSDSFFSSRCTHHHLYGGCHYRRSRPQEGRAADFSPGGFAATAAGPDCRAQGRTRGHQVCTRP